MEKENPMEKAMRLVMKYEREQHRHPKNVSGDRKKGYDIESDGRLIEVKSSKWEEPRNYQEITANEKKILKKHPNKYYLYVVADIKNKTPILKMFTGREIVGKKLIRPLNYKVRFINGIWDKIKSIKLKD